MALGIVYLAENAVAPADQELFAFLQDGFDRTGCGFLRDVELFVVMQHPSKVDQTPCLFCRIAKSFKDF